MASQQYSGNTIDTNGQGLFVSQRSRGSSLSSMGLASGYAPSGFSAPIEQGASDESEHDSSAATSPFEGEFGDEASRASPTHGQACHTTPSNAVHPMACAADIEPFPLGLQLGKKDCLDSPCNQYIVQQRLRLRPWSDIVKDLNERLPALNPPRKLFTDAAVYGRFSRNGSRIAEQLGFPAFSTKEYMHIHQNEQGERTRRRTRSGGDAPEQSPQVSPAVAGSSAPLPAAQDPIDQAIFAARDHVVQSKDFVQAVTSIVNQALQLHLSTEFVKQHLGL